MSSAVVRPFLLVLLFAVAPAEAHLDGAEREAMLAAARAYAAAWLTNDPEQVMATFVAEPVLSPSGLPYREGQRAARDFWWPAGSPPAVITEFTMEELESGGSGDLGFVRGTFRLAFEYDGETYTNQGKYVTLLGRSDDGEWLISHHIWDDYPQGD